MTTIDEMRLSIIRAGKTVTGVADCCNSGELDVARALAETYVRAGMSALLIDFRAGSSTEALPLWHAVPAQEPAVTATGGMAEGHLTVVRAAGETTRWHGNPASMRAALTKERASFDAVICATDPVLSQVPDAVHLSVLSACEGVVVRVVSEVDRSDELSLAAERLKATGCHLIGLISDASRVQPPGLGLKRFLGRFSSTANAPRQ
jgi:hypothetical protein